MDHDGSHRKLTRRAFLSAALTGLSAAALAACGGSTAQAPATAQPTAPAAAPTAAPAPTAAAATEAPTAAMAEATATAPAATATAAPAAAPTNTPLPLPVGSAGKLTVIHRTEYFEGAQTKFRDTVTAYAKQNGVELEISTANPEAFGDFNAKMQAAVQAGNPPDLAYHTLSIPQLHFLDTLEDVSDVVEEAIKKYGDVVPVSAQKSAKIDGKWWAVPFISNSGAWFARKDVLQAAGIDPSTLDTFEKRRDAALKVSDASKEIWGWGLTVNKSGDGHGLLTDTIQAFGGRFVDKSGQKVTFKSPETVKAVTWLAETYGSDKYKPMLPPGIESWTDTSNNEAFLAGKIVFTQNAFSIYAKARKDKNPVFEKIAVLHKPATVDGQVLEAGGSGWFTIFKGSKNIEAAKKLILYMIDPANFTPIVQEAGGLILPAYKSQWTPEVLAIDPNFKTLQEIIFNPNAYTGQAYPADPNAAVDGIDAQAITSQMMANVLSGKMTPEEAVDDANSKIVQIFEELGLPQG